MRSSRPLALLPAVALLAALTGCGDGEDDDAEAGPGEPSSSSSSPSEDDASASEEPSDEPTGPALEVVDRGSGERRDLAVAPEEGDTYETEMSVETRLRAGGAQPPPSPTIVLPFATEVEAVEDDTVTLAATYGTPSVRGSGPAAQQAEAGLAAFEGVVVRTESGPDGTAEVEIEGADDLPPPLATTLQQSATQASDLAPPFPDEPLGEGAVWTVTAVSDAVGVAVEVRTTYTLDRLEGDEYELSTEVAQTLEPGSLNGVEIDGGRGSGTGSSSGVVGEILPTSSSGNVRVTIDPAASAGTSSRIITISEFDLRSRRVP